MAAALYLERLLLAYLSVRMQARPFLAGLVVVALLIVGIEGMVALGRTTANGDAEAINNTIPQALAASPALG